jgi:hypothetical protein
MANETKPHGASDSWQPGEDMPQQARFLGILAVCLLAFLALGALTALISPFMAR